MNKKTKRTYKIKIIALKNKVIEGQTIFKSRKEAEAGIKSGLGKIEDFTILRILGKASQCLRCNRCGYSIKNWHKFCLNCGNKLS